MKKFTFLFAFYLMVSAHAIFAQKVVVIGLNHLSPDGFSFVARENLSVNEVIYFTENEYNNAGNAFLDQSESVVKFTVTVAINAGHVVYVEETDVSSNLFIVTSSGGFGTAVKTAGSGGFSIATNGEGFYAYKDDDENPVIGITDIYSVLYTGSGEAPTQNGGLIPANENPVSDFPNAIVVHGFPNDGDVNVGLNRVEYNPALRNVDVGTVNFTLTGNWLNGLPNAALSIIPFVAVADPGVSVTVSPSSVMEDGATNMVYTFTLAETATSNVTVNFSVGGTAVFPGDYTQTGAATFGASTGTVVIPNGASSVNVTINPVNDSDLEPHETVILTVNPGSGYIPGSPVSATGTITNDDVNNTTPLVALIGINHLDPDGFSFVAVQDIPANTVVYFTDNSFNNSTLSFSSGEAVVRWISPGSVIAKGEAIVVTESSPDNFTLSCSNGTCGTIALLSGGFATATAGETMYAYSDTDVNPSNGVTAIYSAIFTGTSSVSGGNIPSAEDPSTWYLQSIVVDGFPASAPNRVEFTPTVQARTNVSKVVLENVTNYVHAQPNATLSSIFFTNLNLDSSDPVVTVTTTPSSVSENSGTGMVFTFLLNATATSDITINFSVGGTAAFSTDYSKSGAGTFNASAGTVTISNGSNSASITLTPAGDVTLEPDENIVLVITGGTGYVAGTPGAATGIIVNDDTSEANPMVALTGISHTDPDGFSFVAVKDIPANTEVYFTDNSFSNSTLLFSSGEAVVRWTSPGSVITKGNVIVVTESSPDNLTLSCSNGTCGTIALLSGNFAVSTTGETFYAYSDTDVNPSNGVTAIYSALFSGTSSVSGGFIPAIEDPSPVFVNAVVADGFPASSPLGTEYDQTKRGVVVTQVNFEDISNWVHGQSPPALSTVPFANLQIGDNVPPVAVCQNISVELDGTGNISIIGEDLDGGSTDNIGIVSFNASITDFDCSLVGPNNVLLTVTDAAGNSASCTATVTVIDNQPPTITCAGPVTINNTPGLCTGTTTLTPPTVSDNCSVMGHALSFDGVNDYVFGPDDVVPTTGEFTVSVWARQVNNHPGQFRNIFAQGRNLYLGQSSTGFIRVGDSWYITGSTFPTDNQWHHYTIVRKTTDTHLYVDGLLLFSKGSSIPSPGVNGTWPHNLNIGSGWGTGEVFDGMVDEMQIWNYALEQPQIACNMNQRLNGNEPGLVAYFNFEDGPGSSILSDIVNPVHNGTLTNMNVNTAWVASPMPSNDINLKNSFNNTCDATGTYPVGITTVTWTATDASGNTATCTQTVTVVDNEPPTLTNPGNQSFNVIANTCAANYTIADPISDNCAGSMWGYSTTGATALTSSGNTIADGTGSGVLSFNTGVTTVTLTGTDGTNSASSVSFTVTVLDNETPTLANPGDHTINVIANTCASNFTIADPISDNCTGSMWGYSTTGATTLTSSGNTIADGTGSGVLSFNTGVTTVTLNGTDGTNTATTVSFTVTVVDNQPPVITCPDNITVNATTGQCSAVVNFAAATATDNCGYAAASQIGGFVSGSAFPVGTSTITFQASDAGFIEAPTGVPGINFNHFATDNNQTVALKACEAVYGVGNCSPGGCGAFSYYYATSHLTCNCSKAIGQYEFIFSNSGYTQVGQDYGGTSADVTGNQLFSRVRASIGCSVPNTWTIADDNLRGTVSGPGNTSTCSFTITVIDNQAPTLASPGNQSLNVIANTCAADYTIADPISDNCTSSMWGYSTTGATTLSSSGNTLADGTQSGVLSFNTGVTTVTLTGTDGTNSATTVSFDVTVNDNQPPVINCPANVTVNNTTGQCGAVVNYAAPAVSDNCASVAAVSQTFSYTSSIQTFTVPAGITSINVDACGAQGGSVSVACAATGGLGARMTGDIAVTPGEVISILVGQQGFTNGEDGGGGGGSFVVRTGNTPLVIAGGGGGATNNIKQCGSNRNGVNASITTSGTASADGLVAGGTAGNGGGANVGSGAGGGGFYTDGVPGNGNFNGRGRAYVNGGAGGSGYGSDHGGYGGGGCGWLYGGNGGGGGGYSGGGTNGSYPFAGGGGGGSYNAGINQVNTAGFQSGNGLVTISWNTTYPTLAQISGLPSGSSFPVGTTTNTFLATDASGNTATCTQIVTVVDNQPPTAICKDIIVNLSAQGEVSILPSDVDGGSSDNCGTINYVSVIPDYFDCGDKGLNTVTLTINDGSGNNATCTATVTVTDPLQACCANPADGGEIASSQTICIGYVPSSFTSISVPTVFTGDLEYQWQISTVSPIFVDIPGAVSETYTHVGTVTQTTWFRRLVRVTCETAWMESNTLQVDVDPLSKGGAISPAASVVCSGVSQELTLSGQVGVILKWQLSIDGESWDDVFYTGEIYSATVTQTTHFRAVVQSGVCDPVNSASATVTVDTNPPYATAQNSIVDLDASGQYNLVANDVLSDYGDYETSVVSITITPSTFNCSHLGQTITVEVVLEDECGNSTTVYSDITVEQGSALLPPWVNNNTHASANGTAIYSPCDDDGTFMLTATGKSTTTNDVYHFVHQQL
ncbi:MAG: HYR domain-containing protein, partial [Bacteroidales bacterium]|nr:HYR domain-containing protein [Bacteroidales bacterium]